MPITLLPRHARLQSIVREVAMDSITWLVTALALATVALVLSSVGNEIRRRRKFKRYCEKVVGELRSAGLA
jgi:hypothetical protein